MSCLQLMVSYMKPVIIGIPTYNRPGKCEILVRKLIDAFTDFKNVSILVVDNSEIPNSALQRATSVFDERFEYVQNDRNLGLDGSILKLCAIAKKRKANLWFLCDDDVIFEEGARAFVSAISENAAPIKLCKFSYMGSEPAVFSGSWRDATTVDYFRASFLPTLCIDANYFSEGDLPTLDGCNYMHLAIINQMISSLSEVEVFDCIVGSQIENKQLGFSLKDTFITGFINALTFSQIIPTARIRQVTAFRLRGYLSHTIRAVWSKRQACYSARELGDLAFVIYRQLGFRQLLTLAPHILVIFSLRMIR